MKKIFLSAFLVTTSFVSASDPVQQPTLSISTETRAIPFVQTVPEENAWMLEQPKGLSQEKLNELMALKQEACDHNLKIIENYLKIAMAIESLLNPDIAACLGGLNFAPDIARLQQLQAALHQFRDDGDLSLAKIEGVIDILSYPNLKDLTLVEIGLQKKISAIQMRVDLANILKPAETLSKKEFSEKLARSLDAFYKRSIQVSDRNFMWVGIMQDRYRSVKNGEFSHSSLKFSSSLLRTMHEGCQNFHQFLKELLPQQEGELPHKMRTGLDYIGQ